VGSAAGNVGEALALGDDHEQRLYRRGSSSRGRSEEDAQELGRGDVLDAGARGHVRPWGIQPLRQHRQVGPRRGDLMQAILVGRPFLHDEMNPRGVPEQADVVERIAVEDDNIRHFTGLQRAELRSLEAFGRRLGR